MRVVLKRTVVENKCFNSLSGTHFQSHDDSCSGFGNVSNQQQFLSEQP